MNYLGPLAMERRFAQALLRAGVLFARLPPPWKREPSFRVVALAADCLWGSTFGPAISQFFGAEGIPPGADPDKVEALFEIVAALIIP